MSGRIGLNVPYPGSGETWGVFVALALVLVMSGALLVVFRRRNWL